MNYPFAEPSEIKEKTKGNDKVTKEQCYQLNNIGKAHQEEAAVLVFQ